MCGIAGIFDLSGCEVDPHLVRRMTECIVHRGPDQDGYHLSGPIGMGMRRLSIIDLSGGRQPIGNEDGSIQTVYNGEIYNFQEIKSELEAHGHQFTTHTDTEILPHLYEQHGTSFLSRLNGMFAFAIWSQREQKLILVRDQAGIKPLYYTESNGRLYFGSELKCLTEGLDFEIDRESVFYFLSYGYIPAPRTIYKGVFKLPPGHYLVADRSGVRVERYWRLEHHPRLFASETEALDEIHALMRDAVRISLVSDVPLGAFLSGGVDSSLVVAMMAEAAAGRVRTFSISFDEEQFNEGEYARYVAERLGTDHHDFRLRWDIKDHIEKIIAQFDEPFADESAIPTYYLCRMAREHVTVALSGDGGDEICAGYRRYQAYLRKRRLYRIPGAIRRGLLAPMGRMMPEHARGKRFLLSMGLSPQQDYVTGHSETLARDIFRSDFLNGRRPSAWDVSGPILMKDAPTELDSLCRHDFELYLPDDCLTKVDRMSMAWSLEVRVPLLDHRLVELMASVPANLRLHENTTKYAFKRILERYLPSEYVHRPKRGFGVPIGRWFRNELKELFLETAGPDAVRRAGVLRSDIVDPMVRAHMEQRQDYQGLLWRIFVLQSWLLRRSGKTQTNQSNAAAELYVSGGAPS